MPARPLTRSAFLLLLVSLFTLLAGAAPGGAAVQVENATRAGAQPVFTAPADQPEPPKTPPTPEEAPSQAPDVACSASVASAQDDPAWSERPVEVNIQVHLETPADQEGAAAVLAAIEARNDTWRTTVFVTPDFAFLAPHVVRDLQRRGFQVAVVGVPGAQSLAGLPLDAQSAALAQAFASVRAAVDRPDEVVDWKPQDFQWDPATLSALRNLHARSISDLFTCGASFQCQCPHALSQGRVTFPYPMQTDFWTIPVSDLAVGSELLALDDRRIFDGGASADDYGRYLGQKYAEQQQSKDPLVIVVHGALTAADPARLSALEGFLDQVAQTGGKVVTISNLAAVQGYITNFNVQAPSTPARSGQIVQLTITYNSTLYCPKYRFRAYGKYQDQEWQLIGSSCQYVPTGSHTLSLPIEIPKPPASQNVLNVRVVGQASRGSCDNSDPDWPTAEKYEVMKELQLNLESRCIPLPGRTNGQSANRLDIVFVPNTDYGAAAQIDTWLPTFLSEVGAQIDQRLNGKSPVSGNLGRFNFFYTRDQGHADASHTGPSSTLPTDLTKDCPFADAIVVIHKTEFDDSSSVEQRPNVFSAEGPLSPASSGRSFIHEGGHGLFGLADEYDGKTHYFAPNPNPNIWATEQDCRTDATAAGWNPDDCNKFTSSQGDWWKLGTTAYIMEDGTHFDNGWGLPAARRITGVLNQYHAAMSQLTPDGLAAALPNNSTHLQLTLSSAGFSLNQSARVLETPPNQVSVAPNYTARIVSLGEQILAEIRFGDPRIVFGEPGYTGPVYLSSANFTLNLPYFYDAGRVEFRDEAGALVSTIDIAALASGGISGLITGPSGAPVAGTRVDVVGPDFATATTGSDGRFSVLGLTVGSYVLNIIPPSTTSLMPAVRSLSVYAGQVASQDVSLQLGATVRGRVLAAGWPVPNAILYMTGYETPRYSTDSTGSYAMRGLPAGNYTLNIDTVQAYKIFVDGQPAGEGTSVSLTLAAGQDVQVDFRRPTRTYLPLVLRQLPVFYSGIVTDNGAPMAGLTLEMRYYNGSGWSTFATAATDGAGYYRFATLPSLTAGQRFYVRWRNPGNDTYISGWYCDDVLPEDLGTPQQCSFNIHDLSMIAPSPGATVALPTTFRWNIRPTTADDYEVDLADMADFSPYWWQRVGYTDHYTLVALPTGFTPGTNYGWFMWVYGPNGYGVSYYYYVIRFSGTAGADLTQMPASDNDKLLRQREGATLPLQLRN